MGCSFIRDGESWVEVSLRAHFMVNVLLLSMRRSCRKVDIWFFHICHGDPEYPGEWLSFWYLMAGIKSRVGWQTQSYGSDTGLWCLSDTQTHLGSFLPHLKKPFIPVLLLVQHEISTNIKSDIIYTNLKVSFYNCFHVSAAISSNSSNPSETLPAFLLSLISAAQGVFY